MSVNIGIRDKHYAISSFSDWFLPSIDELAAMYTNLHLEGVGGFNEGNYWSSTEISAGIAWGFNFALGSAANNYMKTTDHADARACRSFTTTDVYELLDTGPSGGLIFYITNNGGGSFTYLECSPAVVSTVVHYSNVEALIGVTAQGTAVGTGQANTTAIISQALHTASAAKDCNDLIT